MLPHGSAHPFSAPPAVRPSLEDCAFYHSMDLPTLGLQVGNWDLRGSYDQYFGGHDFSGERVLDIGTANGALAFEMERRGAREVVGFDLDDGISRDCRLPTDAATWAEIQRWVARVKNGFWLARDLLGSRVNVAYGHAGNLPADLGWFETVMMGNILQHLQDPIGAVLQAARHSDHLIITEADWLPEIGDDLPCMVMYDLPNPFSWYQVKPALLQMLLKRWGFIDQKLTWHTQVMLQGHHFTEDGQVLWKQLRVPVRHYTLSASRRTCDG